jgi:mannose-6-phosphate isomerase-like protein (cupin superfamily)
MTMDARVLKKGEGKILIEGEEFTEIFLHTDKLLFSISSLLPGQRAVLDPGHPGSDEVCYVIQGTIAMHLPQQDQYFVIHAGDALYIPPDEPHYATNVDVDKAVMAWALAPRLK